MKVTYIKLENVAGLLVGIGKDTIEIDFTKSNNKIVAIRAKNASGKTTLLSSISPFAYVTSLDDRSNIPYIAKGKNGYKEIHYQDGKDEYIIKHYFKASKDTHSVKSYFMKNGEELNENGNVSSFNSCVEIHLGLTQEMMRLVRIGTNVNSFITLTPAKRKEYIGKLIEEIDMYLTIYKKINDDIRVVKTMLQTNNTNLYNCHISDPVVEEEKLTKMVKDIHAYEKERDKVIGKIGKITALMKENDIHELRKKMNDAEGSIREFDKIRNMIIEQNLENSTVDSLIQKRIIIDKQKVDTQANINSNRIMIDSLLSQIERLELNVKKITSDNDIQSLMSTITELQRRISDVSPTVSNFVSLGSSSDEVNMVLGKLASFNQISNMINSFGNKPLNVYLKLRREGRSVDVFLKEQAKRISNNINESDLRMLMDKLFANDIIITPNCDTEYKECPYFRLSEAMNDIQNKLQEESYSSETLRCIQIIANNIDAMLNELDRLMKVHIPEKIKDEWREKILLDRIEKHLQFFDLTDLQSYLSILREWELYTQYKSKLQEYEYQLKIYQKAGVNTQMNEINHQKSQIARYKADIDSLSSKLGDINTELSKIDSRISLVTKYQDSLKYRSMYEQSLKSIKSVIEPLESAEREKMELDFQERQLTNTINTIRQDHHILEMKLETYRRLVKEGKELNQKNTELSIIMEAVSTKKGIPVFYMKRYLNKIQKLSNDLLSLIYGDEFMLASFVVTPETFEVPYIKNNKRIPDIKYASQSEIALSTMALSFALANNATDRYNILLLDEIDAGLDETNRAAFLEMLHMQMDRLDAEQVFIISQNLGQMANIPMDCIDLSDVGMKSPLQNIVFEA